MVQDKRPNRDMRLGIDAEVIHPYMGWKSDPQTDPKVDVAGHLVPVNSLGFVDDGPTLFKRSSGQLLIGITGGSVAEQMSVLGEATLRKRLSQNKRLRGYADRAGSAGPRRFQAAATIMR